MNRVACKPHMSTGLLAHVGAFRREPHLNSFIPGPKTGDFSYPAEAKLFHGLKTPPYAVGLQSKNGIWWLLLGIRLCSRFQSRECGKMGA